MTTEKTQDAGVATDSLNLRVRSLLVEIGEDLMESIGDRFPPDEFPPLNEIFDKMEEHGQPYGDDAMTSVCVVNAKRIDEFLKSNALQ